MLLITKWLAIVVFFSTVILSLNYTFFLKLSAFDDKRVLEVLLFCPILLWTFLGGFNKSNFCWAWGFSLSCIGYILLILVGLSVFLSTSLSHAILETSLFCSLFYGSQFVAVLYLEYKKNFLNWLVCSILIGAVFYMVGFYSGYLASFLEKTPLYWPEPFLGSLNVRFFNQYQLWVFSLLYIPLLMFKVERLSLRYLLFFVVINWWVLLFASVSRGVLIAWFLAMLLTLMIYRQFSYPLLRLQLKGFITGLITYELLFYVVPCLLKSGVLQGTILRGTTYDRIGLWKQAFNMITMHPWLGVGPMHYAWYPNLTGAHPHNGVLQLASEFGLPATIILFLLFFYAVISWLNKFNIKTIETTEYPTLIVVLFFTLVANVAYSLVDGVIVMPLSQIMMTVIMGLMFGVYRDGQKRPELIANHLFFQQVFAVIVLIALEWSILPELIPRILGEEKFIPRGFQTIGPRFWQEGGIPH